MTDRQLAIQLLESVGELALTAKNIASKLLMDDWLSLQEAVDEFGLTESQVKYAGRTGRIRTRQISPRKTLYSSLDLDALTGKGTDDRHITMA